VLESLSGAAIFVPCLFENQPARAGKEGASVADGVDRPFAARRDRRGRFLKGASGNPVGRPPGIMNQATRDAAVLLSGEAGALTRKAIELALAGDIAALRLCIDRIIAPQKEQPIAFAMPPIDKAGDLAAAATALTVAAAQGAMTPAEAASLAQVLEAHARISEVTARIEAERLAAWQKEVGPRCDLRVCVVMAHHLRERFEEEEDGEIRLRIAEMRRIGRAAWDTLATIPDTPALVEADRASIVAHPLPLDRSPHPLGAQMRRAWDRFSRYFDRAAEFNQRAQTA
jgi:uncharacterized protein DUF5681